MRRFRKTTRVVYLGCTLTLLVGCSDRPVQTVPVKGQVTFGGGECPGRGSVSFLPVSVPTGMPRRPAAASFDVDGKFRVTSFQPHDGLVPGTYQVRVECWRKPPSELGPGVSFLPKNFSAPDVSIDADSAEPILLAIDVPPVDSRSSANSR